VTAAPDAVAGPQGWLWTEPPPLRAAGAGRYRLRWVGADARGSFRGAKQTTALPEIARVAEFLPEWGAVAHQRMVPLYLGRQFLVAQRCIGIPGATSRRIYVCGNAASPPPAGGGIQCDLIVVDAAGRARVLAPRIRDVDGVLPRPDGGVALRVPEAYGNEWNLSASRVWSLDARGALVGTRVFVFRDPFEGADPDYPWQGFLAADQRGPGLALPSTSDGEAWTFYPIDPTQPGRRLPPFRLEHLAPCANAAPSPSTVTLLGVKPDGFEPGIEFGTDTPGALSDAAQFVLEPGADGALCLRARLMRPLFEPSPDLPPGQPPPLPVVLRARRGTVRGTVVDRTGVAHAVTCAPESTP
jgi:hypothetical protein